MATCSSTTQESGGATSIRQAACAYKVYYAKVPTADGSDYTVDHSGYIYLMDRAGQYLGFFRPARRPTVWQMLFDRWLTERTAPEPCNATSLGSAKGLTSITVWSALGHKPTSHNLHAMSAYPQ